MISITVQIQLLRPFSSVQRHPRVARNSRKPLGENGNPISREDLSRSWPWLPGDLETGIIRGARSRERASAMWTRGMFATGALLAFVIGANKFLAIICGERLTVLIAPDVCGVCRRKKAAPERRPVGLITNPPAEPLTNSATDHIRCQFTSASRANGRKHARCNRTGGACSA